MYSNRTKRDRESFLIRPCTQLNGSVLEYLIVTIVFVVLTLFYTNFVLLHGTHQLFIDGVGDGTAGIAWSNTIDSSFTPWNVHTDYINYPIGRNLSSFSSVTSLTFIIPIVILTKIFGAVMALNLVTFWGFLGTALTMYWLVKRLTGSILAAFFAGFAVTFTPYHLVKSSAHLAYGFSLNFVLILAAFIGFWHKPTWRRTLLLSLAVVFAYYTDGYFILLASIFLAALFLSGLVQGRVLHLAWRRKIKQVMLCLLMILGLSLPIIAVQLRHGSEINGHLSGVRDSIVNEMNNFSSIPADYFVPVASNPWLGKLSWLRPLQHYKNAHSNQSENATYIGYTVLVLCFIGSIHAVRSMRKRGTAKNVTDKVLLMSTITWVVVPILAAFSLRPVIHGVPMPSQLLIIAHLDFWRVLARFYLPMHVVLVTFAAYSLALLFEKVKLRKHGSVLVLSLTAVVLGFTALEFATTVGRPSFDFRQLPKMYTWLKNQKDIQVIAELPITDRPPELSYPYATAQIVHGKKLINDHTGNLPTGSQVMLGGVDNPEAVDYAVRRGAQLIVSHGAPCQTRDWGVLAYKDENISDSNTSSSYGQPICAYIVKTKAAGLDNFFVTMLGGENGSKQPDGTSSWRSKSGHISLAITDEMGKSVTGQARLKLRFISQPSPEQEQWKIMQDSTVIATGDMSEEVDITVDAARTVTIICGKNNTPCAQQFEVINATAVRR